MKLSRPLILASASPRRAELLRAAGVPFIQATSQVNEEEIEAESNERFVVLAAEAKALDVASRADSQSIVIGADTIVCLDHKRLGKPRDMTEARQMIRSLQSRRHEVLTGVAICIREEAILVSDLIQTSVWFGHIPDDDLETYLRTDEPYDKAGAYGIQGWAGTYIARIEGDYTNVVGLPVNRVLEWLAPYVQSN